MSALLATPLDPITLAAVTGSGDGDGPQFVIVSDTRRPSSRYAWTGGGEHLGDQVDALALNAGMHGFDYFAICCGRHYRTEKRGQLTIYTYDLTAIHTDVAAGRGATPEELAGWIAYFRITPDRVHRMPDTPWLGVGPQIRSAQEATS